jgi:4-hydroxy-tetrahydrodipicolinate synthase
MFRGSIPALITPFQNGEVDLKAFADFVDWQVVSGSHGVVPCGTTGESPVLDEKECESVIRTTVSVVNKRVPVIAGTGSNSTRKTIQNTLMARQCGADAALIVVPYYNRPTQDGLFAHYKAVHDSTDLPIILYNVPGRCGTEISAETVIRLAELPQTLPVPRRLNQPSNQAFVCCQAKMPWRAPSWRRALTGAFP